MHFGKNALLQSYHFMGSSPTKEFYLFTLNVSPSISKVKTEVKKA
jgi:hypothetical protein